MQFKEYLETHAHLWFKEENGRWEGTTQENIYVQFKQIPAQLAKKKKKKKPKQNKTTKKNLRNHLNIVCRNR